MYAATTTAPVETVGVRRPGATCARRPGSIPSRPSAKLSLAAPTQQASAQLKAETIAPSVMMLPIHEET